MEELIIGFHLKNKNLSPKHQETGSLEKINVLMSILYYKVLESQRCISFVERLCFDVHKKFPGKAINKRPLGRAHSRDKWISPSLVMVYSRNIKNSEHEAPYGSLLRT